VESLTVTQSRERRRAERSGTSRSDPNITERNEPERPNITERPIERGVGSLALDGLEC